MIHKICQYCYHMNLNVLNNTIAPQHVQNYSWSFAKASVATNDLHLGKVKKNHSKNYSRGTPTVRRECKQRLRASVANYRVRDPALTSREIGLNLGSVTPSHWSRTIDGICEKMITKNDVHSNMSIYIYCISVCCHIMQKHKTLLMPLPNTNSICPSYQ